MAFAANLVTLFLFYEILTLSTFPLVTHSGSDEARRAGRTYLGLLLGTSIVLLLLAILWTWTLSATLDFTAGGILAGRASDATLAVLLALYVFGIGKAALMPFHRWLPAAMVAPTPVSALLHAVAVVKAGVFTVLKVAVYVFGIDLLQALGTSRLMMYAAVATLLLASLVALRQSNLSYVVLGAMLATGIGVTGGALHIAMHAFGKITLFFCAGAILIAAHKTEVGQLDGIGRAMPLTMAAFAIGSLSMIGLPPTAGFVSKWYLMAGAVEAGATIALAALVLSTLINAAYFLPIVYAAFFRAPRVPAAHGEAPPAMVGAILLTAAGTVLLFLFPDRALALVRGIAGG